MDLCSLVVVHGNLKIPYPNLLSLFFVLAIGDLLACFRDDKGGCSVTKTLVCVYVMCIDRLYDARSRDPRHLGPHRRRSPCGKHDHAGWLGPTPTQHNGEDSWRIRRLSPCFGDFQSFLDRSWSLPRLSSGGRCESESSWRRHADGRVKRGDGDRGWFGCKHGIKLDIVDWFGWLRNLDNCCYCCC